MTTAASSQPPNRVSLPSTTAERISAGCYGALIAASTLIGLGNSDLVGVIALVVLTNLVYYATHVFAYSLGDPDENNRGPWQVARHHFVVSAPMISAAFAPLIVIIVLVVLGVVIQTAVLWGVLVALLYLVTIATAGAYLRRYPPWTIVAIAIGTIVLAAALVIVKVTLH